jgi:hypothetical protein
LEILRYIFFGVAIMEFFLIRWVRRFILLKKVTSERTADQRDTCLPKIQKLVTTAIITYAFCESVAIFGLRLFLITRSSLEFYFFVAKD